MGKIILEFDSVEELSDAKNAMDGLKWKLALYNLDQNLRSVVKHGQSMVNSGQEASEEEQDLAYKIREAIRDMLISEGLSFED
jgi:hypothetical protein